MPMLEVMGKLVEGRMAARRKEPGSRRLTRLLEELRHTSMAVRNLENWHAGKGWFDHRSIVAHHENGTAQRAPSDFIQVSSSLLHRRGNLLLPR